MIPLLRNASLKQMIGANMIWAPQIVQYIEKWSSYIMIDTFKYIMMHDKQFTYFQAMFGIPIKQNIRDSRPIHSQGGASLIAQVWLKNFFA